MPFKASIVFSMEASVMIISAMRPSPTNGEIAFSGSSCCGSFVQIGALAPAPPTRGDSEECQIFGFRPSRMLALYRLAQTFIFAICLYRGSSVYAASLKIEGLTRFLKRASINRPLRVFLYLLKEKT